MEKSQPGHLVKVICKPENRERVAQILAEETETIEIADEAYDETVKIASDDAGDVTT